MRSTTERSPGRIGPGARLLHLTRRGPLRWAAAVPAGVLCWWLLLTGGPPPGVGGAALGVLALGSWSLGVLPVHSDRTPVTTRRPLLAQAQPARGGVEPGGLQDGAQR